MKLWVSIFLSSLWGTFIPLLLVLLLRNSTPLTLCKHYFNLKHFHSAWNQELSPESNHFFHWQSKSPTVIGLPRLFPEKLCFVPLSWTQWWNWPLKVFLISVYFMNGAWVEQVLPKVSVEEPWKIQSNLKSWRHKQLSQCFIRQFWFGVTSTMMENLPHHMHHMSPAYGDLEFYSSTPNSTNGRGWKESSINAGNNNNISSDAESGFSINVSTGNTKF